MQPGDRDPGSGRELEDVEVVALTCTGTTRRGAPCRNRAVAGGDRCHAHRRVVDEEAVTQLAGMLRAGNYLEIAARSAGVELGDLLEHPQVRADLETARAASEAENVARIMAAGREEWRAAAWLLERQYPDRWARPATRPGEEKAPPPIVGVDALDELAGKRASRRARSIGD